MEKTLELIYVIGTYPGLTTTFIDREITTMRHMGADLQIVAIRRPNPGVPLSAAQIELQRDVTYLVPFSWLSIVASHLYFFLAKPRRFWATLLYLVSRPHPGFKARWMTCLHFAEGVYAAFLLRDRDFHELHSHFADRAAIVALVAGRLLGKPYSMSIHAGPDIFVNPVLIPEKIGEARKVVTCTAYNKLHLETIVKSKLDSKVSCLHHGLELSNYPPYYSSASRGQALILAVGQLAEHKGFVHLIRACRALKDQGYEFTCHIVGKGPQGADLESLIESLGLTKTVILCGPLPHERVIEKYRRASVFALPCVVSTVGNMDGIPNVLAEAMAMQVPVISTALSGIPELVEHGVDGLLIRPGDDQALASAMAMLLDNPSLRAELGRNGRQKVVEMFDLDHNIRRFAATLWPDWFEEHPSLSPLRES